MAHRPLVALVVALTLVRPCHADADAVQYAYDALGRLAAVADGQGRLAVYRYDAVGNLVAIDRRDAVGVPGGVTVTAVVPGAARRGAAVSVFGQGFAAQPADNEVTFGVARATVLAATSTRLLVTVPEAAATAHVHVATAAGRATSPEVFRALGQLALAPGAAVLVPGASVAFVVTDDTGQTPPVAWSVGGRVGGDPSLGLIDAHGLYVAPATPGAAIVSAISLDDPSLSARATVSVTSAVPLYLAAAPVGIAAPAPPPRAEARARLGVGPAPPPRFLAAAPVTVVGPPIVSDVSPREAPRGAVVRITITGAGLHDILQLELLLGDRVDDRVTVAALAAAADGTGAAADVAIAADAAAGPRVVHVVTATGSSPRTALGANVFTIR